MALNTAALRFDLSVKMYNFWWCNTQILLFIWANWSSSKAGGRKIERQRKKQCKMHDLWVYRGRPPAIRGRAVQICCLESLRGEGASLFPVTIAAWTHIHIHTFTTQTCLFASLLCTGYHTQLWSFHLTPQQANKQRYKRTHKLSNTLHTCKCPFYIIKCII